MQRPVAQLKLVQSMLKIFVPPRANSVFGESELHTQHMWKQSAFCREKPSKSKVSAILKEKWMCVSVSVE